MEHFLANPMAFKELYLSENLDSMQFPGTFSKDLDEFQRLVLIKILRPDYFKMAVKNWIRNTWGVFFTESPLFDIEKGLKASTHETPILLITATGSDPLNDVKLYAREQLREIKILSLGQGQDKQAEAYYVKCVEEG
mmetsp:Transcript_98267/g.211926  ORF Transcript_98267/g.211926 Transcript_98267/m.211926 type:complete len:137 (+) Transcript_98267:1028-1438(+)